MIEDIGTVAAIPLQNVTGPILNKIIEYWRKHAEAAAAEADVSKDHVAIGDDLRKWDKDFAKVDQGTDDTIPLQNVTGPILSKVIEYCRRHAKANVARDPSPLTTI
ncbi:SKP1-like protein 1A [Linum grandiflorum]